MDTQVFDSWSFWALDPTTQSQLRHYVDFADARCDAFDGASVYRLKPRVLEASARAVKRLQQEQAKSGLFPWLLLSQKIALEGELLLVFYVLSAQLTLNRVEQDDDRIRLICQQINQCADLLNALRRSADVTQANSFECMLNDAPHYTRYLGLRHVTPVVVHLLHEMSSGHDVSADELLSFVNERRLYWVWGSAMTATLLTALPQCWGNTQYAFDALNTISPVTGAMSWILYFTRGGMQWCGLLQHTFSAHEQAYGLTRKERFLTQWQVRKYKILNDTIWGLCNLACYFMLYGNGILGYAGNVATAMLLLMDLTLTCFRQAEEESAHAASLARCQEDIRRLEAQIQCNQRANEPVDAPSIETLREALLNTQRDLVTLQLDWKYKRLATSVDLWYAISLLVSFAVLCCFFFPPLAVLPVAAGLLCGIGTLCCFALNVLYAGLHMGLNVSQTCDLHTTNDALFAQQLDVFKQLVREYAALPDGESTQKTRLDCQLKQTYWSLMDLTHHDEYAQQVIRHQRIQLVISLVRDALIPVVFIAALALLPLGVGIPVLVVALALAVWMHYSLINAAPKPPGRVALDTLEFARFRDAVLDDSPPATCQQWLRSNALPAVNQLGFFKTPVDDKTGLLAAPDGVILGGL